MTRYKLPLLARLGMRWSSKRNLRDDLRMAGACAVLVACFSIAGEADYREELRQEAEAQEFRANATQATLIACMNGRATWITSGIGQLAVVCKQAEEIRL